MDEYDIVGEYIKKNYPPNPDFAAADYAANRREAQENACNEVISIGMATTATMSQTFDAPELVTINTMAGIIGIGHNCIRQLVRDEPDAEYIMRVGTRIYLKKNMFIKAILARNTI